MEEEMRFHLEMQIEQNLCCCGDGGTEEAHYAARRQLGNQTWLKEASREMWSLRFIETLIQDLRYGARMLLKNPGFTCRGRADTGPGHRREYGDFQCGLCAVAASVAVPRAGAAGAAGGKRTR